MLESGLCACDGDSTVFWGDTAIGSERVVSCSGNDQLVVRVL